MGFFAVVLWFGSSALVHLALTDVLIRTLPPFISSPRDVLLLTGILEVLGLAGLTWRRTRRMGGWLLAILTLASLCGDGWLLAQGEGVAFPRELLILLVPLHISVLLLTLWSTRPGVAPDARWSRWR